ncbi:MAG: PXPV repeat protein [Aquabacterium sp.]|nr:PXPV repeat protein [Aquabacterium sp.]
MNKRKLFVTTALALAGTLGVGLAQARDADVQWSVTIGAPGYVQPLPVYTQPYRVYAPPVHVYARPAPVYVQPAPSYYYRHSGYQHSGYQQPTRWDRDGDGVPNRRDGLYNPAWDRDGDGIPNRQDRYDNTRHDRDGDGIPNRYDRRDGREWRGR